MIDPSSSEESDAADDPGDRGGPGSSFEAPSNVQNVVLGCGGGGIVGVVAYQVQYQGSGAIGSAPSSIGSGIWSQRGLGMPPGSSCVDQRSMSLSAASGGAGGSESPGGNLSRSNSVRPSSPSPSLTSDKDSEKSEKEEEERRKRLLLYVFVMRCVAYPFNAKQPTDMARRQAKVTRQQLQTLKERFQVG